MSKTKNKTIKPRPNGGSGVKRGRISRDEDKAISKGLAANKSVEDIALSLKRPFSQIDNHVRKFYGKGEDLPAQASEIAEFARQLRQSVHWKKLQSWYNKDDLAYYEELYVQIMNDFKDDIKAVDQLQLLQALDNQMIMNEHKKHRKDLEDQIYDIESRVNRLKVKIIENPDDEETRSKIIAMESQKQGLVNMVTNRVRQFTELSAKFDKTMDSLKMARNQRLKNKDDSNVSFTSLIKHMNERKVREKEGKIAGLVKYATDREMKKLQQPHRYHNGEIDQPILTPENILIDLPEEAFEVLDATQIEKNFSGETQD